MKMMIPIDGLSRMGQFIRSSVKGLLVLGIALTGLTTDIKAQDQLTPLWQQSATDGTWFANDNNTRGIAFNRATGNLLVVSRTGGLKIVKINAATGDSVGVMSVAGVTGGVFAGSLIDVSPDGRIFLANLTTNATTGPYKIYSWLNEDAEPKVIYSGTVNDTALRFGDSFRADFTDGASMLYAGGTGNPNLAQFTYDATQDTVSAVRVFNFGAPNNLTLRAVRGIAPIPTRDLIWVNEFDYNLRTMDVNTGELSNVVPETVFPTKESLWVDFALANARQMGAVFPASLVAAGQTASIIDVETGVELAFTVAGPNANGNAAGGPLLDIPNKRMYLLATNNQIASYDISAYIPEYVNVTFTVNTSTIADTVSAGDLVQFRGNVNGGESDDYYGQTVNWGSGSLVFENVGGDYWQRTVRMKPGDVLTYKIYTGKPNAVGEIVDHNGGGWEANNPAPETNDYIFALPALTPGNVEIPVIYYNRTAPFEAAEEGKVALFFRVNVGAQSATGDIKETTQVGVRGTPAVMGNPDDWSSTNVYLTREGGTDDTRNVFYSGVHYVDAALVGTSFAYKYVYENEGATSWEDGADRPARVVAPDTTFQYGFFSGRRPPTADVLTASLQFAVNVGVLEELGLFNSAIGDRIAVPGGFNGWNTAAPMVFNAAFNAWTAAYTVTEEVGARLAYKYYVRWDQSRIDPLSDNFIANIPTQDGNPVGWEEPGISGGGDRFYTFTNETEQTVDDFGSGIAYYNGVPPQGVIRETIDGEFTMPVTFKLDMTAATSHTTPFDPANDKVYMMPETPIWALTQALPSGDGQPIFDSPDDLARVEFTRVGTTLEYELVLDMVLPTENHIGFTIAFVKPGETGERVINGGGFAAGRRYYRYITPLDASDINDILWSSATELNPIVWKATDLDFEMPPSYGVGSSIDSEELNAPDAFVLHQNYPNPFNPTTNIRFTLPISENVQVSVYNVLGQRVATLVNGVMPAGSHSINFNAATLASGVYIYRIQAGGFTQTKSMMLVK